MKFRHIFSNLSKYILVNLLVTIIIFFFYLVFTSKSESALSWIFLPTALISTAFMLQFVIFIVLAIIAFILPRKKIVYFIFIVAQSVFVIFCVVDLFIFRLYNFHFNGMVVNMLTTDGFWDSVSLGSGTWLGAFVIIASVLFIQLLLFVLSTKIHIKKSIILKVFVLLLIITTFEKFLYAYADIYNKISVTRYSELYPLYQPLTMKGFASNFININKEKRIDFNKENSRLDYPKEKIEISDNKSNLPNIVLIAIDGWRFDMFNKSVSPNITNFAEKALVFKNHYSGGNASRFGIFSIFYGIHGYYWHSFLNERQSPVFIDTLQKLNYNFRIISSTRLTFPEFRKTAFVKIPEYIEDSLPGKDTIYRDANAVKDFVNWHKNYNSNDPFFSFMFLDAPHAKEFPEEFNKFKSESEDPNYLFINEKNITKLKNAYMNAVLYDDYLISKLLDYLKKSGSLKDTIIIITADHGEEFYEEGNFGHNSAFTEYQLKVPFVMYIPGRGHEEVKYMTSHLDIVPTLMRKLGVKNNIYDYSLGTNMLNKTERNYIVACNWDSCATYDKNYSFVFSFETYKSTFGALYDKNYNLIDNNTIRQKQTKRVLSIAKDFAHFFK
ncbi:sulfatase-like hydrolase/transferase [Flexistipes sp.]|uniref:sulfatase-like hydrolase/transferase n=1 Tax=Flexistipes sp. TaxID=3088135 RepID=UPI002E212B9C|nr:sulfatase-like hydrolase/transferase [Flexistipes sp.]